MNHKETPSIIELNLTSEPLVIQGARGRARFFADKKKPLQFIHLSDIHNSPELWVRMVEYLDYYSDYISFALHTGDYCGGSQASYTDLYARAKSDVRPILNCVGNHDVYESMSVRNSPKERVHSMLFSHTEDWGVEFSPSDFSMSYCKDFIDSGVRLIVIDEYYDADKEEAWLREKLSEAKGLGLHVITSAHQLTSPVVKRLDTTFNSLDDYEGLGRHCNSSRFPWIEKAIIDFKKAGGIHIAHLAGHEHWDLCGYTEGGVFNYAIECATSYVEWCDASHEKGTKTYDCFNVVSVDTELSLIKFARIGNNTDHYLRQKNALCYNYKTENIIYNA